MSLIFSFNLSALHTNPTFSWEANAAGVGQPLLKFHVEFPSQSLLGQHTNQHCCTPLSRSSGDEPISAPRTAWNALFYS